MKKLLVILSFIALSATVGWLWQKNQLLSENTTTPTNIVESIKQKGFSLTAEEEALVLKLAESGSNEDQIISAITERREILANIESKNMPSMCKLSRQEVLRDAYNKGVTDVNEIEKLAATYDLVCFGETDIEIPESAPQGISEDKPSNKILENMEQKCQEQQAEYNSCLIRYNTKMIEWQNCQSGNKTFGCPLVAPSNSCGANISSWCRKQILGHY